MKGAGVDSAGEHLKDKYGRLTRTIPELMQLRVAADQAGTLADLAVAELEEKIAKQSVAPLDGRAAYRQRSVSALHREAAGAARLARLKIEARRLKRRRSYSGNSMIAFWRWACKDVGEKQLSLQDLGAGRLGQ